MRLTHEKDIVEIKICVVCKFHYIVKNTRIHKQISVFKFDLHKNYSHVHVHVIKNDCSILSLNMLHISL